MSMMGYKMLFPIIKIKDKQTGREHIVGTNSHDKLNINADTGEIYYTNLQCGEGTGKNGSFEFIGNIFWDVNDPDEFLDFGRDAIIEFITFEELLQIYKEQIDLSAEFEKQLREIIAPALKKYEEELKKNKESKIFHT